jgi:hypothetical protein
MRGRRVRNALARKLESLRDKGATRDVDVAKLLGTQAETVSRWDAGRAYPEATAEKTLVAVEYIVDLLADFYQPHEAREWIFSAQKLLSGSAPADLIREGQVDEVLRLVGQLFTDNLDARERLEVIASEEVEWRGWARRHGFQGA